MPGHILVNLRVRGKVFENSFTMHFIKLLFATTISFNCFKANAQQPLPVPLNIKSTYDKGTRSSNGKPGKNYWQNTADYDLKMHFDPITRLISGTEEIDYTNNSPDTLRPIFFKLYPNLYKKGSVRSMSV